MKSITTSKNKRVSFADDDTVFTFNRVDNSLLPMLFYRKCDIRRFEKEMLEEEEVCLSSDESRTSRTEEGEQEVDEIFDIHRRVLMKHNNELELREVLQEITFSDEDETEEHYLEELDEKEEPFAIDGRVLLTKCGTNNNNEAKIYDRWTSISEQYIADRPDGCCLSPPKVVRRRGSMDQTEHDANDIANTALTSEKRSFSDGQFTDLVVAGECSAIFAQKVVAAKRRESIDQTTTADSNNSSIVDIASFASLPPQKSGQESLSSSLEIPKGGSEEPKSSGGGGGGGGGGAISRNVRGLRRGCAAPNKPRRQDSFEDHQRSARRRPRPPRRTISGGSARAA